MSNITLEEEQVILKEKQLFDKLIQHYADPNEDVQKKISLDNMSQIDIFLTSYRTIKITLEPMIAMLHLAFAYEEIAKLKRELALTKSHHITVE